jgi:hypothetical protein
MGFGLDAIQGDRSVSISSVFLLVRSSAASCWRSVRVERGSFCPILSGKTCWARTCKSLWATEWESSCWDPEWHRPIPPSQWSSYLDWSIRSIPNSTALTWPRVLCFILILECAWNAESVVSFLRIACRVQSSWPIGSNEGEVPHWNGMSWAWRRRGFVWYRMNWHRLRCLILTGSFPLGVSAESRLILRGGKHSNTVLRIEWPASCCWGWLKCSI